MAWQQSDLDVLEAAIASNILEVSFADGRKVRYQSAADMLAVRNAMKGELAANASRVTPLRRVTRVRVCR